MTVTEYFDKYNINYVSNFSTAQLSSIKAGGIAKYVLYPRASEELVLAVKLSEAFSERIKIIGGCTNTCFSDKGFDGIIINTSKLMKTEFSEENIIAEAGASLAVMLKEAAKNGIELASGLFGIPGSIGGAVRNNAGAYGASISDIFLYGDFYDTESSNILKLDARDLLFSYRSSILQSEKIVFLRGVFKGNRRDNREIAQAFKEIAQKRRSSHPNAPSLGSFFKRSDNYIPAELLDKAGLKGESVGGAEVSEKHAGFIINSGGASFSDINNLAIKIEKIILEKYGVELIREAELVN